MLTTRRGPIERELSDLEMDWAVMVGRRRQQNAINHGLQRMALRDAWESNCCGAMAELVVSLVSGHRWLATVALADRKLGDVAGDVADVRGPIEVRWTPNPEGRLVVRAGDDATRPYVLVVGRPPRFRVVGWLPAWDVVVKPYAGDPVNGVQWWGAPQGALRELPEDWR